MPGDMRPGTEWGMMWGFSGDVTLWVLFGGRPGLELKRRAERGKKSGEKRGGGGRVGSAGAGGGGVLNICSTPECNPIPES